MIAVVSIGAVPSSSSIFLDPGSYFSRLETAVGPLQLNM